ncbi:PiggyBac transposable element-derived protein [Phytophthora cactorum]|nr:PiggyBac transposable element-derived protein [Phytophthora cactorum]
MSRHSFEQILNALAFEESTVTSDTWRSVRPLIDSFNYQRRKVISPGNILLLDECMSSWKGRKGIYAAEGLPHTTKIARKPQGVGTKLKSVADGEIGILLGLDLVEGAKGSARSRTLFAGPQPHT